jgi:hypothetical protein
MTAGAALRVSDQRCVACGYGIALERPPGRCPMCGDSRWAALADGRNRLEGPLPSFRSDIPSSARNG